MYGIIDFNKEKDRVTIESLEKKVPMNLTHLREIYQDLMIVNPNLKYNPDDDDQKFWKKCIAYSNALLDRAINKTMR